MAVRKTPRLGNWLLKVLCRKEYLDEVKGDLEENFYWRIEEFGLKKARTRYYLDVLSAVRLIKVDLSADNRFTRSMFLSFIKSSFRNFKRHWSYTFLNVFGLALGMVAALFILEYVSDELNYNKPSDADRIYRVSNDYYRFKKMIYESSMTFSGVGPAMQRDLAEVESYARLFSASTGWGGAMILTRQDKPSTNFKEHKLFFADPAVIDLFDIPMLYGANELDRLNTVLLTPDMATKYFGDPENAVGQTLRYNDNATAYDLRVAGIFERPDYNLQVDFDVLISYGTRAQSDPERFENDWGGNAFITFVKLRAGVNPSAIEAVMDELALKYKPGYQEKNEQGEYNRINRYFLTNIQEIHLNSTYQNEVGVIGNATTVNLLQVIAVFIVVMAWINFINLTTAKSINRAREVGVRKVLGARRKELVLQFFTEAFLINLFALIFAVCIVLIAQGKFNGFTDKNLALDHIQMGSFVMPGVMVFFIGTFLSGLYPALILSSHQAVLALKGKSGSQSGISLRRALIVFQLLFSSLLIIATLTINRQLDYMNKQEMGFEMDQVLVLRGPAIRNATNGAHISSIRTFKERLLSIPNVQNVGTSSVIPGIGILRGIVLVKEKTQNGDDMKSIERVVTDNGFHKALGMRFIAGEGFDESIKGFAPIVLNEAAMLELGFQDPKEALGQTIYEFGREERVIVGILENYHHESLNRKIDPMYFVRNEVFDTFYTIRLANGETAPSIKAIENLYSEIFPGNPAEYYFLDSFFKNQYKQDEVNSKVFSGFALMAIVVACLGLYGLSSFSVVQRTKEIGVRKVLGAKVQSIYYLLSKEIILLAGLGFLLAVPVAYYSVDLWLKEFAYHIEVEPWLFLLPFGLVLVVTLLAVSRNIISTALTNPVKSLRHE